MSVYREFADTYDYLMRDVPYDISFEIIKHVIDNYIITKGRALQIADLACGTGTLAIDLARQGYKVIGIDLSENMLAIAEEKQLREKLPPARRVNFLCQDLLDLEIPVQPDLVISFLDSLNYIIDINDLKLVFNKVYNQLANDGIMIFDLISLHKISKIIANKSHFDVSDDIISIWENSFDEKEKILSYDLSILVKEEANLYRRSDEYHEQRAYTIDEIRNIIEENNFIIEKEFSDYNFDKIIADAEDRYFWILRK